MRFKDDPSVHQLAKDLGLPPPGDPLTRIREFALDRVRRTVARFPAPVADLETLRLVLADRYRVRIEFLSEDSDIRRVGRQHVPQRSVICAAFESSEEVEIHARENQSWWEHSKIGRLPALPLDVQATRRGGFVYGLIRPEINS